MKLMPVFLRAYPLQTAVMLIALLMASVAEGIGLSALLPLLNIGIKKGALQDDEAQAPPPDSELERVVTEVLNDLGIQPGIEILLVLIVIAATLKNLLLLVAQRQVGYTAAQVTTDLRLEVLHAVLRSKWEFFLNQPIGRLTNSLATEAQRSSGAFVAGTMVITLIVQVVIYALIALAVSWQATLVSLAAGLVIVGVSHFLVRMARRAGKKQTKLLKSMISKVVDTLQSVKPLKAMAREHLADNVLSMKTSKLMMVSRKQIFSSALLKAAQEEMTVILIALGIFVTLVKLEMPLATVMVLVVVLGKMLGQLGKVQNQYQKLVLGESAYWSLKKSVAEARRAEEAFSVGLVPTLMQSVQLDATSFSYDQHRVLSDVSLEIPAGRLTTLIGPSGSGKTTIVDLVIGLLHPQSGAVRIDGTPLTELDLKAWRHMIGYVPQETLLLHESILHNVTLDDPELSEQDAVEALQAAGAWEFVSRIPAGIHSTVGERGTKLSGGQRQRIIIARALVHKPKLLILDEATSAMDPQSAAAIVKTMEDLRDQLTVLAISHQTALVESADRVYRVHEGGVSLEEKREPAA
jgi:ATP-binding cassette subfamily C protein